MRRDAPAYYYPSNYNYAAPGWYRPWVYIGGSWTFRPYPYHVYYYRQYYRGGPAYYRGYPTRGYYGRGDYGRPGYYRDRSNYGRDRDDHRDRHDWGRRGDGEHDRGHHGDHDHER